MWRALKHDTICKKKFKKYTMEKNKNKIIAARIALNK